MMLVARIWSWSFWVVFVLAVTFIGGRTLFTLSLNHLVIIGVIIWAFGALICTCYVMHQRLIKKQPVRPARIPK